MNETKILETLKQRQKELQQGQEVYRKQIESIQNNLRQTQQALQEVVNKYNVTVARLTLINELLDGKNGKNSNT